MWRYAESPECCLEGGGIPFRDHLDEHPADRCRNSVDDDPSRPSPDHDNHVATAADYDNHTARYPSAADRHNDASRSNYYSDEHPVV